LYAPRAGHVWRPARTGLTEAAGSTSPQPAAFRRPAAASWTGGEREGEAIGRRRLELGFEEEERQQAAGSRYADPGAGHLAAALHAAAGAGAPDGAPRRRAAADLPRRRLPPGPAAVARRGLEPPRPPRLRHRHAMISNRPTAPPAASSSSSSSSLYMPWT
ncbi:hypothetical protein BAE44_0018165, partial [Dichanthelium oligosanthes]